MSAPLIGTTAAPVIYCYSWVFALAPAHTHAHTDGHTSDGRWEVELASIFAAKWARNKVKIASRRTISRAHAEK